MDFRSFSLRGLGGLGGLEGLGVTSFEDSGRYIKTFYIILTYLNF